MIGKSIGPYQLIAELGRGGMGEVHRARDTSLNRDVALKILPELFATDADRLARFEREAQALAALNHPNIAQVYAIAPIPPGPGASTGGRAIVMELVEGEDLSDRIKRGPIPLDEALSLARQIAFALEAAHEAGIIHRDLKPANIKVRPDGTVKVLDFGLAKWSSGSSDPSESPTFTARGTDLGLILGTAAYMAPEQAKGRLVDRRADTWAFGVVLYEMLTGRRAFGGDDVTEVLAAVMRDTPDPASLPSATPAAVRRLLRRCLEKDVRKRLRDMGDVGVELDEAMSAPAAGATAQGEHQLRPRRSPIAVASAAIVFAALAAGAAWSLKPSPAVARPISRFTIVLDGSQQLSVNSPNLAWSRDGRHLAYRVHNVIYVRSLDDITPREVAKAPGAGQWFSPDGKVLAFNTTGGLTRVAIAGGASQALLTAEANFGLDWAQDGTIVYSDGRRILRLPETGGDPSVLVIAPEGTNIGAPHVLPGGRAILYSMIRGNESATAIKALDGTTSEGRTLLPGVIGARYVQSGHLLYGVEGRLMAIPFDASRLEISGAGVMVPEPVYVSSAGLAQMAVSDTGALAYMARDAALELQLLWVDQVGQSRPALTMPRNYSDLVLSRNGQRAAIHIWDQDNDIWVADLVRGGLSRLTFTKDEEETPHWSPDEKEIAYTSASSPGKRGVFIRPADGNAATQQRLVWEAANHFHLNAWSPDRRTMIVEVRRATQNDLLVIDVETGQARDLLASPYGEYSARFSHDGKWLAYVSEESGKAEVYVQPFPAMNSRVVVSTAGGLEPIWSRDNRRLFFRSADSVMEASVTSTSPLQFAAPKALFRDTFIRTQGNIHTHFDVGPDNRFLMIENPRRGVISQPQIQIVLNWADELKRIAPATK